MQVRAAIVQMREVVRFGMEQQFMRDLVFTSATVQVRAAALTGKRVMNSNAKDKTAARRITTASGISFFFIVKPSSRFS